MADPADIAAETIETCQADALRRVMGKSGPESHPDYDGTHCVEPECGVTIPPARRKLGKVRCVECQARLERQR